MCVSEYEQNGWQSSRKRPQVPLIEPVESLLSSCVILPFSPSLAFILSAFAPSPGESVSLFSPSVIRICAESVCGWAYLASTYFLSRMGNVRSSSSYSQAVVEWMHSYLLYAHRIGTEPSRLLRRRRGKKKNKRTLRNPKSPPPSMLLYIYIYCVPEVCYVHWGGRKY